MNKPYLIKATSPSDLIDDVTAAVKKERDLYGPLFVSHEGLICQWVIPIPAWCEYALIAVGNLDDLERKTNELIDRGYDHFHHTLLWNDQWYLQWMARTLSGTTKLYASRELQMVEDARPVAQLVPVGSHAHLVTIPYPVNVS